MTDEFDRTPPDDDAPAPRPMQPRRGPTEPPRRAARPSISRTDDFQRRTFDLGEFEAETPAPPPVFESGDDFVGYSIDPASSEPPTPLRPAAPIAAANPRPAAARPTAGRAAAPPRSAPKRTRRRTRQPSQTPRVWFSTVRSMIVILAAAVMVSTIFSLWTRPTFFSDEFRAGLNHVQATQRVINIQNTPLPKPIQEIKIGVIAGHSGQPQDTTFDTDPGAVCDDGLTELSINEAVAQRVVAALRRDQYTVDLLQEFDPRLKGYQADALVSIHTNDCSDYGMAGTGYNAASAAARQSTPGKDERLLDCLVNQYGATTGLPRHYGITLDMTEYHNFGEVSSDTPTAIIEIGYMRNDRALLTGSPDLVAQGIANGVRCFLRPDLYQTVPTAEPSQ